MRTKFFPTTIRSLAFCYHLRLLSAQQQQQQQPTKQMFVIVDATNQQQRSEPSAFKCLKQKYVSLLLESENSFTIYFAKLLVKFRLQKYLKNHLRKIRNGNLRRWSSNNIIQTDDRSGGAYVERMKMHIFIGNAFRFDGIRR